MVSRMMLNEIFRIHYPDVAVLQAASGEAALTILAEIAEVAAAILDFNMPGMNGLELADALVATGKVGSMALLTANVQDAIREKAEKRGLAFINKPITEDRICAYLKTVL
jgi:two-component system chemotaxis response regulator CheY